MPISRRFKIQIETKGNWSEEWHDQSLNSFMTQYFIYKSTKSNHVDNKHDLTAFQVNPSGATVINLLEVIWQPDN